MEQERFQKIAIAAGLVALIAALAAGRLPQRVRVLLIVGLVILASGAGLFAYRYVTQPITLRVAAGSLDGDAPKIVSAIATRLAATGAPIRLKVIEESSAANAIKVLSAGGSDLAIARADLGDLSAARAVVTVTHGVVMIVVPPGSSIDSIANLQGKTVGVVGADINRRVTQAIFKEYDVDKAKIRLIDIAPQALAQSIKSKQIQAILVVMPISEKYLGMLRDALPRGAKQKFALLPIESAGAIAAVSRAYESFDIPKGTLRGSPPVPDDDLTTLRVPIYLVANQKLDNDTVTALTKAIMQARRDLMGEYPILAQMSAPSTDKDALISIHPGAAAYFDGDEKTIFDKYGDQLFYGSMLLGSLMSLFAAAWKFMTKTPPPVERPAIRVLNLITSVDEASNETELAKIEHQINDILQDELRNYASGEIEAGQPDALALAMNRLEYLIGRRRLVLNGQSGARLSA